jgi:hypothetical protein
VVKNTIIVGLVCNKKALPILFVQSKGRDLLIVYIVENQSISFCFS